MELQVAAESKSGLRAEIFFEKEDIILDWPIFITAPKKTILHVRPIVPLQQKSLIYLT